MTLAELQQGSLEHNSHLHAGLRSAPPIPVVSQYQSEPYSSYVGDQPPASQQYGHPYIPPYVPQAHPHNHHRERPSRDLDPERDDPNHLGRPVALSRLTSDVSGKSSPGMDAFSGDDAELLLSKSHGSGTFEERGAYGRERGMSNASGRLDERIVPGRERGGSNASGRASPYGGAFLQPRQAGPRGPMGSPGLPNDHVAGVSGNHNCTNISNIIPASRNLRLGTIQRRKAWPYRRMVMVSHRGGRANLLETRFGQKEIEAVDHRWTHHTRGREG
jgi:hypothetical protein